MWATYSGRCQVRGGQARGCVAARNDLSFSHNCTAFDAAQMQRVCSRPCWSLAPPLSRVRARWLACRCWWTLGGLPLRSRGCQPAAALHPIICSGERRSRHITWHVMLAMAGTPLCLQVVVDARWSPSSQQPPEVDPKKTTQASRAQHSTAQQGTAAPSPSLFPRMLACARVRAQSHARPHTRTYMHRGS